MSDHTDETKGETTTDGDGPTPYERFQSLTKRLLHVSKDDLREAEAREQERRRSA